MRELAGLQKELKSSGYWVDSFSGRFTVIMSPSNSSLPSTDNIVLVLPHIIRILDPKTKNTIKRFTSVKDFFSYCSKGFNTLEWCLELGDYYFEGLDTIEEAKEDCSTDFSRVREEVEDRFPFHKVESVEFIRFDSSNPSLSLGHFKVTYKEKS